jgi:hypothetical protein
MSCLRIGIIVKECVARIYGVTEFILYDRNNSSIGKGMEKRSLAL